MSFATRAVISLPSGIGAGLLGFWAVWRCLVGSVWDHVPGPGYDGWLLAGIFVPGVVGGPPGRLPRAQPGDSSQAGRQQAVARRPVTPSCSRPRWRTWPLVTS